MTIWREEKEYPIFRMKARMNDTIHVKVKVVIFKVIRVGFTGVYWNLNAFDDDRFFFDRIDNNHRVFLGEPPIEGRNSHRIEKLGRRREGRCYRRITISCTHGKLCVIDSVLFRAKCEIEGRFCPCGVFWGLCYFRWYESVR